MTELKDQVGALRKGELKKEMSPELGKARAQRGKAAAAGGKKSELLMAAQRVARELGQHGPITIDDVTSAMAGDYNVMPSDKRTNNWKGSVFGSEWICVGDMPSRQQSAHARPVKQWALKTWLQDNSLNGRDTRLSAYRMLKLYKDFTRATSRDPEYLKHCRWYVGGSAVSADITDTIEVGGNSLYGIPVRFVPGAVGAIIFPPED